MRSAYPVNTRFTGKNYKSKQLFGFFVNELGLRISLSGKLNFREILLAVTKQQAMDGKYQHYPLIQNLLAAFRIENPALEFPFNVGLGESYFFQKSLVLEGVSAHPIDSFDSDEVISDLFFLYENATKDSDRLGFAIKYNSAIFKADFVNKMALHLTQLLEGIVENPEERIEQLPLLTEQERHQLLVEWNQTETGYPCEKTIHELFEEQVERSPDEIALVFEDQELSYRELNVRANQLGHYLQTLGVGLT